MLKNGDLITCHEEGEILVFSNKKFEKKTLDPKHNAKITTIAFDIKEEFIATGDVNGLIVLWNRNWDVLNEIPGDANVINICFSRKKQNIFIFYEEEQKLNFKIYDFKKNIEIQSIDFQDFSKTTRYDLELSFDENTLILYSSYEIAVLKKIKGKYETVNHIQFPNFTIRKLSFKPNHEYILVLKGNMAIMEVNNFIEKIVISNEKNVKVSSIGKEHIVYVKEEKNKINIIEVRNTKSGDLCCAPFKAKYNSTMLSMDETRLLTYDYNNFQLWNLITGKIISYGINDFEDIVGYQKSERKQIAFVGKTPKIYFWENGSDTPFRDYFVVPDNPSSIRVLDFSFDDQRLLIFTSHELYIISFPEKIILSSHKTQKDEYFCYAQFSWKDYKVYLATASVIERKNFVKILDGKNILKTLDCPFNGYFFIIEPNNDYLIIENQNVIYSFNTETESIIPIIEIENMRMRYYFINKNDFFIESDDKFEIYPNFLKNPYGYNANIKEMRSLVFNYAENEPIYKWLFPFKYYYLQIYSYCENLQEKFYAKEKEKINDVAYFFLKDVHERNAFDVIFLSRNSKLFTSYINNILKNTNIDNIVPYPYIFGCEFINNLILMFEDNPKLITQYLDFIFADPTFFPKEFSIKSLKTTILIKAKENHLSEDQLIKIMDVNKSFIDENAIMKEVINAKCLYAPDFLDFTNKKTLEIFKTVSNFEPTNPIFANKTIIRILEYKWDLYARSYFLLEALWFLIFLSIYLINANYIFVLRVEDLLNGVNSNYYIYAMVIDFVVLGFIIKHIYEECLQLYHFNIKDYITNLWNVVDIILLCISSITITMDIMSCLNLWSYTDILKVFHCFTVFFGFLRLLSYARGFEGTAFMIKLIIQVIIDIRNFLMFLFLFIMALSCSGNQY